MLRSIGKQSGESGDTRQTHALLLAKYTMCNKNVNLKCMLVTLVIRWLCKYPGNWKLVNVFNKYGV